MGDQVFLIHILIPKISSFISCVTLASHCASLSLFPHLCSRTVGRIQGGTGGAHSRYAADGSLTHSWPPWGPQSHREPLTRAPGSGHGCQGPGWLKCHRSATGRHSSLPPPRAPGTSAGETTGRKQAVRCVVGAWDPHRPDHTLQPQVALVPWPGVAVAQ